MHSPLQVWVAVAARCLLHVVYEFQAFVNLYAQKVLSISPGAAAQVLGPFNSSAYQASASRIAHAGECCA